jgi:hypothetical protein
MFSLMKKIQMILASAAFLLAGAGVFASTLVTTVYYRPNWANKSQTSGLFCQETVATPPCSDVTGPRCTKSETYVDPDGGPNQTLNVIISKRIDGGDCQTVLRDAQ